jgi:hypothetical protein
MRTETRRTTHCLSAAIALALGASSAVHAAQLPLRAPDSSALAQATGPQWLLLRAGVVDPSRDQLVSNRAALDGARDSRYAVVQFAGDGSALRDAIARAGGEVVGFVPNRAYVVRRGALTNDALAALPGALFADAFHASWKVDPGLFDRAALGAPQVLEIDGFPGESAARIGQALRKFVRAAGIVHVREDARAPRVRVALPAGDLGRALDAVALLDGVAWVGPYVEPQLHNDDSVSPMQANAATGTPIWDRDITGAGQIVAISDSGLDRNESWFTRHNNGSGVVNMLTDADSPTPPAVGATWPMRKVYGYWVQPGATGYDNNADCGGGATGYHGTHVVGTVAGDRGATSTPTDPAHDAGGDDGMAPNAQILFQDIGNDTTGCLSGLSNLRATIAQASAGGAHLSNNSWGAGTAGAYAGNDVDVDAATWGADDLLFVVSAGNDGPDATSIGSPGNAKNALTVGATGHGNATTIAGFSSRGPTQDQRIKPDIVGPGSAIVSAAGNADNGPLEQAGSTLTLSGTSMSAPTVTGAAALLRQYFEDGWYPRGARTPADRVDPNGALTKALLLNGTAVLGTWPTNTFGWGRLWLESNLYFNAGIGGGAGDTRRARFWERERGAGLATGEQHVYTLQSVGAGEEFRVTLAWFDPEGGLGAAISLVNNLDLEVVGPNGTDVYRGNVFVGGASSPNTGSADARNTVEQVRIVAPVAGTYQIRVRGAAVPGNGRELSTRQGYAVVASGSFGLPNAPAAPAPGSITVASNGLAGIGIGYTGSSAQGYQLYRAEGSCGTADSGDFRLIASASGNLAVDDFTQGGYNYAYKVRAIANDVEGAASSCIDVLSADSCTRRPSFDSTAATRDFTNASCSVQVGWPAATSNCPAAPGVSFRIERDSSPYFPAPTTVAAAATGTNFTDSTVVGGTPYYYRITAVDAAGNLSTPSSVLNATPVGPEGASSGLFDDVDDNSYMSMQGPWQITNVRASSGAFSYHNAADGQTYAPDTCAAITTIPVRVPPNGVLSYKARFNLEANWDGVVVEISTNGGASWADLPPAGGYPGTLSQTQNPPINACGYAATQGAFTGSSGGVFNTYTSNLTAFAGQTVLLRWRFTSDPGSEEEGFYLDEVSLPQTVPAGTLMISGFEDNDIGAVPPPPVDCN